MGRQRGIACISRIRTQEHLQICTDDGNSDKDVSKWPRLEEVSESTFKLCVLGHYKQLQDVDNEMYKNIAKESGKENAKEVDRVGKEVDRVGILADILNVALEGQSTSAHKRYFLPFVTQFKQSKRLLKTFEQEIKDKLVCGGSDNDKSERSEVYSNLFLKRQNFEWLRTLVDTVSAVSDKLPMVVNVEEICTR